MTHLCLFISADGASAAAARRGMEQCGFRIVGVEGLDPAIDSLNQWRFDAVVLDARGLGSAIVNGVRLLRARCPSPIVLLGGAGSEERQLQCLAAGATDIVELGASPRLIGWKLRQLVQAVAAHRPAEARDCNELRLGRLRLDPARGSARFDTVHLDLSAAEFDTLLVLVARAGQLVGRSDLGGPSTSLEAALGRSIDTRIYRIRRHLAAAGATELDLATVHGRGYRLALALTDPATTTEPATATDQTASPPWRPASLRGSGDYGGAARVSEPRSWRP
jgi:DNA-binding response OmpR family regulator